MAYSITINGVDRTSDVISQSVVVEDVLNDKQNICSFKLFNRSGLGFPSNDQEVIITLDSGSRLFAGKVINSSLSSIKETGFVMASIQCTDYVRLFDSNLVRRTYELMTDKEIIEDIVSTYCAGLGFTTTNVIEGVTIDQITFNYLQPSQCLRQICDLTGRNWYIDYSKDIHYFPLTTTPAPFNITSSSSNYFDLTINKDASQIKNRVYVRGGTKLSDTTTHTQAGDGQKRIFILPEKPHDVSVEVDTGSGFVAKTLGIKNIDLTGYDWYLNFQEKYIEQDSGGSVLTDAHKVRVTYKYDIPILIALENTASILENGTKEFAIFDKSIKTTQAARERAAAELTDYASKIVEGKFKTYTDGFSSGQYININLSAYDVNSDYIVQRVTATSMGAGKFVYTVELASSKTMGIIRFLIELLEANKNLIELNDDEVLDELLTATDSLLSDSLTELLTIDSAGPYRTWAVDSLEATSTRIRWNLFEWR